MPTYTYACTACERVIEKRQSFSDAPLTVCETCGGSLRKVIHPVGIVFKGSGWYVTDSRGSSQNGASEKKSEPAASPASSQAEGSSGSGEGSGSSSDAPSTPATSPSPAPAPAASSSSSSGTKDV